MAVAVRPSNEVITGKQQLERQRRVVVTGMGVVTPIGDNPDVFYDNLLEGVSGISEIQSFDCSPFQTVHIFFTNFQTRNGLPVGVDSSNLPNRKLQVKSSISRQMDGSHQKFQRGQTNSLFTLSLLGRKHWQMLGLPRKFLES